MHSSQVIQTICDFTRPYAKAFTKPRKLKRPLKTFCKGTPYLEFGSPGIL